MFSRRTFLRSLSRSALVLPLADVFAMAVPQAQVGAQTTKQTDLGVRFENIAHAAGLTEKTVYGGEHKNQYLLETTGCGVAFYDYDSDGWLDIFVVNGWRLEGFPSDQEPTSHLFKNNRDGTFTDVTATAGLVHSGWGQGVCVADYDNDGFEDLVITYF